MNKIVLLLASLFCFGNAFSSSIVAPVDENTPHVRNYTFNFSNGNMLPNWSFEDDFYSWTTVNRFSKNDLKKNFGDDIAPISGSYVGVAHNSAIVSDYIPVEMGQTYTLSLYVYNLNGTVTNPRIVFYSEKNKVESVVYGDLYGAKPQWNFYKYTFTAPENALYAKINLMNTTSGYVLFDDVILERGLKASNRNAVTEKIDYLDVNGKNYMTQVLVKKEFANELLPNKCFKDNVVYASKLLSVSARSKVFGGNLLSGDSIFIDNDVTIKDDDVDELKIQAKKSIYLGDRDTIVGTLVYGKKVHRHNQDYVKTMKNEMLEETCDFEFEDIEVGSQDVYVPNDNSLSLMPGKYKNIMIRARSTLYLSAGEYFFDSFELEPTAVLNFDLQNGNVVIHVKSNLRINDNTSFVYDTTLTNFIKWNLSQSSSLRLGTISNLSGVFVAPNARIELGHQSSLRGVIYARKVNLMQDSKISAPSFLFTTPKKKFAVSEKRYDSRGLLTQTDLPYVVELSAEGYIDGSALYANTFYSVNGDGEDAMNYAYSETRYAENDGRVLEKSIPGFPWRIGGNHSEFQERMFVSSLDIPKEMRRDLAEINPIYELSYSKNAEGQVTLSWTNKYGQEVQLAHSVECVGTDMRNWKWSVKRFEYTREGRLYKVLSPLDVASGNEDFAIVSYYDAAGKVLSQYIPDKGLTSFYYSKDGSIRLIVSEEQRQRNAASYRDYDERGRVTSSGETVLESISDDYLRNIGYGDVTPGLKKEYMGVAYDNAAKCFAAINDSALYQRMKNVSLNNTRGMKVCTWARNQEIQSIVEKSEALVADFFSYDALGRIQKLYRYTGIESDANRKVISMNYNYDDLNRLSKVEIVDSEDNIIEERNYFYNDNNKISFIRDENNNNIASFEYDDFGKNTVAMLGDNLKIKMGYNLHGSLKTISAINLKTGRLLYEQKLNYENVDDGLQPRFDGRISQNIMHINHADTIMNVIHNFLYDMSGNLVRDDNNGIEHLFEYDENGRILSQIKDGKKIDYDYKDKSYELNMVDGLDVFDSTRNAHSNQNYVYDASGRMIEDKSKNLLIEYDANGRPVCFTVNKNSVTMRKYNLYDASGIKVSELLYEDGVKKSRKTDLVIGGKKIVERHQNYEINGAPVTEYLMIYGKSGVVGRIHSDKNKEWYVKDYQGSVVMTSFDNRRGSVTSYEPYGNPKQVVIDGDIPSEQYTGKEYDSYSDLYYFGSRYYDPMLGLWISPDPQNEFFNPYGRSNDPVNNTDKNGECELVCWIVIGVAAAVGAYVGGSAANDSYNPADWDWSSGKTWGYMGVGAVIGAIAGASGYGAAVLAGEGMTALGFGATTWQSLVVVGAVGSGVSGAVNGFGNTWAFGGDDGLFSGSMPDAGKAAWTGGWHGFIVGGLMGMAAYYVGGFAFTKDWSSYQSPAMQTVKNAPYYVRSLTSTAVTAGSWMLVAGMVAAGQFDWLPIPDFSFKMTHGSGPGKTSSDEAFDMSNDWGTNEVEKHHKDEEEAKRKEEELNDVGDYLDEMIEDVVNKKSPVKIDL